MLIVLFLWTLPLLVFSSEIPDKRCTKNTLPTFTNYTVPVQNTLKHPKLKLNNEFSRMFKTRLSNNLHENTMELPFVVHTGLFYEYEAIEYKADSRLLIISGYRSEDDVTQNKYFFS